MGNDLSQVDFGLDPMPGDELHAVLRGYRDEGPVRPTRFLGIPSFVISGYDALLEAFTDSERFPPHLMYRASFEPAILARAGGSFMTGSAIVPVAPVGPPEWSKPAKIGTIAEALPCRWAASGGHR